MPIEKRISLFGGLSIERDGIPAEKLVSRKADMLLAYLAYDARQHSREKLATLFWEDRTQKQALSNLRTLLSSFRKHVPDFVNIERQTLSIKADVSVDTTLFLEKIETALNNFPSYTSAQTLEKSLGIYKGDFLEGVHAHGSTKLDEWSFLTRDFLQQKALLIRKELSTYYAQQGAYNDALRHTTILLESDVWNEAFQRQMMQLLVRNGQRQQAVDHYENFVRILEEEIGISPEAETVALFERIKNSASSTSAKLPSIATSFVGRERELANSLEKLRNPDCRLLTLVGLGGIGKTRLALQIVAAMRLDFMNGVHFVSLAAVENPDSLATVIAEAIEAPIQGTTNLQEALKNYLREKEMLLVLDNFEHLLPAAKEVAALLEYAPSLKFLATSRLPLNLRAEWLFELSGLEYAKKIASGKDDFSALLLFEERARVISPDFQLTPDNLQHVNRICQIVHGMPLGIEMAAAWIRVLSPKEIVQEIEKSLELLKTDVQDVPERQRNLTAVFDSVWALLSETEKGVFAQLSVFHGTFTLSAFQTVTEASAWTIASLVEKSFLQKDESGFFYLVELLRLYSASKLDPENQKNHVARQRHSEYYLNLLVEESSHFNGRAQAKALQIIGYERENIHAAWVWAVEHENAELLEMSSFALTDFYKKRGPFAEGIQLLQIAQKRFQPLEKTQSRKEDVHSQLITQLCINQANLLNHAGSHDESLTILQETEERLHTKDNPKNSALFQLEIGRIFRWQSKHDLAKERSQIALSISKEHGYQEIASLTLGTLGDIHIQQADYISAKAYYEEAYLIAKETDNNEQEAKMVNNLGVIYTEIGDFAQAKRYHQRSLQIKKELGDINGESMSLSNLGIIALGRGYYLEAKDYFEKSRRLRSQLGNRKGEGFMDMNIGRVHSCLGRHDKAKYLLDKSLQIARDMNSPFYEAQALAISGIIRNQAMEYKEASEYYRQTLALAKKYQYRSLIGHANHWAGQALLGLGNIDDAHKIFQKTLKLRDELGEINLIVESQAGLAAALLAKKDLTGALALTEEILLHLQEKNLAGTDDPFQIRLVCAQVLSESADPRAKAFIQASYDLLNGWAMLIKDSDLRKSFLENVPAHANLMKLYETKVLINTDD